MKAATVGEMAYDIEKKLVIAIASSALFDLEESDKIYREQGLEAYRTHQRQKENETLKQGVAFALVKRILGLNQEGSNPVEVILLSRNDPDTGLRVMKSIAHYKLDKLGMSRAIFVNGSDPFRYMPAINACLFLSGNESDVRHAIAERLPAGRVFPTDYFDRGDDMDLRIAFDFDGVIASDSSEKVYKRNGIAKYQAEEKAKARKPLDAGPLADFFKEIASLQKLEKDRKAKNPSYKCRLRTAIVTARNAPAHERVVTTLRSWGIEVDEVFFLGGIEKKRILEVFKPHIFFDDQVEHIKPAAGIVPSVHVPFGAANAETATGISETKGGEEEIERDEERRKSVHRVIASAKKIKGSRRKKK